MPGPVQYALTVVPLAGYLWLLGTWHAGRYPRVVSGLWDYAALAAALGGWVVVGPVGDFLVRAAFARPDGWDRLALASALGLAVTARAPRAFDRLAVYHVRADRLDAAVNQALGDLGAFTRTLGGYEEVGAARPRGVAVEVSRFGRAATVEARGTEPSALIRALRPRLRRALRAGPASAPSALAAGLYAAATAVAAAPLVARVVVPALVRKVEGG